MLDPTSSIFFQVELDVVVEVETHELLAVESPVTLEFWWFPFVFCKSKP